MAFQLVLATDDEITVWHTDLGHIFQFAIDPPRKTLVPRWTRDIPEATEPAGSVQDDAYRYAVEQARLRRLIG